MVESRRLFRRKSLFPGLAAMVWAIRILSRGWRGTVRAKVMCKKGMERHNYWRQRYVRIIVENSVFSRYLTTQYRVYFSFRRVLCNSDSHPSASTYTSQVHASKVTFTRKGSPGEISLLDCFCLLSKYQIGRSFLMWKYEWCNFDSLKDFCD